MCFCVENRLGRIRTCLKMSHANVFDFHNVCRTCLSTGELKSLYEECSVKDSFVEMLVTCTSVTYFENDGLPIQICNNCIIDLSVSYKFAIKCRESDNKLRLYMQKLVPEEYSNSSNNVEQSYTPLIDTLAIHEIQNAEQHVVIKNELDVVEEEADDPVDPFDVKQFDCVKLEKCQSDHIEDEQADISNISTLLLDSNQCQHQHEMTDLQKPDNIKCFYDIASMKLAVNAVRRGLSLTAAAKKYSVPKCTLSKHYKDIFGVGASKRRKVTVAQKLQKSEKVRCLYGVSSLKQAVDAVKNGLSLHQASYKFNVPKSTLARHYKTNSFDLGGGRKQELSSADETKIATFLLQCGCEGFGLTKADMFPLVKEFLRDTGISASWGDQGPGLTWFNCYMKRHPEVPCRKREKIKQNGFEICLIHSWFESLEKVYNSERIEDCDGGRIYSCVETSFTRDGNKNTSVIACCSADGNKMPPFIIFDGDFVWANWISPDDYPGTVYVAKKDWNCQDLFLHWFESIFLKNLPSFDVRNTIILIYDDAFTHVNYKLAKTAYDNKIVLMKLSPHMAQPLNKTVFSPMKTMWNKLYFDYHAENPGTVLPHQAFSNYVKVLWEQTFEVDLIVSGFKSTGLFPLDSQLSKTSSVIKLEKGEEFENMNQ